MASTHLLVLHSEFGTEPQQVLKYALSIFIKGAPERGLHQRASDRIVVVFDRDEHQTYHAALAQAAAQNGKLKNDEGAAVQLDVVVSVPCFELWLLLHFEDVHAPLHRHEALERLKAYLPDYEKGGGGHWGKTQAHLSHAIERAHHLAAQNNPNDGIQPYTAMHELVSRLIHLKA